MTTERLFEDGEPKRMRAAIDNTTPEALLYLAYPLHLARGAALKMIRRALKTIDFDTLMAGIERYKNSDEVQGHIASGNHQFIKRCATWFDDECWDDETPETPYQKRLAKEKKAREAEDAQKAAWQKRALSLSSDRFDEVRNRLLAADHGIMRRYLLGQPATKNAYLLEEMGKLLDSEGKR